MGNPRAIDFYPFRGNGEFGACLAGWVIEPEVTSLSCKSASWVGHLSTNLAAEMEIRAN